LTLSSGGRTHPLQLMLEDGQPRGALLEGATRLELAGAAVTQDTVCAVIDDERHGARWFRRGTHLHVWMRDAHHEFIIEDPRTEEFAASATSGGLTTPLPGVVSAVNVQEGQAVAAGEVLMVIEAMKMEHSITAPYEGTVRAVHFARGDRVRSGPHGPCPRREP